MQNWIIPYLKQHWRDLAVSALLGMLAAACAAGLLFTSGYLISKAALRPENILMIYVPIVGVRAFGIFRAAFAYAAQLTSHDTILRVLSEMRVRLFKRLEPMALFLRSKYQSGDLLGLLSDDIEHLQDVYLRTLLPAMTALLIYAAWVALIGAFDPLFAFLFAAYLLILIVIFPLLSLLGTRRQRSRLSRDGHLLYERLTDAVLGSGDWLLSGRQRDFLEAQRGLERQMASARHRLALFHCLRDFLGQLLIGGGLIAVLFWSGTLAASGSLDRTLIAAFALVFFSVGSTFLPLSEAVERAPQYTEALNRLDQLPAPAALPETDSGQNGPGAICARHVYYRYGEQEEWAVRDVSLKIDPGARVALIGRSGAGKSTLIHLIYGALFPVRGRITLDGTDCSAFGRGISRRISVLNQSPHLFDTSVLNNIALGNVEADRKRVVRAAQLVGLHEKIESLPKGYDTQMHEAGAIFSGGEQERVALARILLQDNPIVILDEPTVGLDPQTEKALLKTVFSALKGKTLIWITHHLTGTEKMDQIIFMEDGQIEMQGTHRQLLVQYPRYRRLYQMDVPFYLRQNMRIDPEK